MQNNEVEALKLSLRLRHPEWPLLARIDAIKGETDRARQYLDQAGAKIQARQPGPSYDALSREARALADQARQAYGQYESLMKDRERLTGRFQAFEKVRPGQGASLLASLREVEKSVEGFGGRLSRLDEDIKRPPVPLLAAVLEMPEVSPAQVKAVRGEELFILGCNFVDRGWLERAAEECFAPLTKASPPEGRLAGLASVALNLTRELGTDRTGGIEGYARLDGIDPTLPHHQWLICLAARAARSCSSRAPAPTVVAGTLVEEGGLLDRLRGSDSPVVKARAGMETVLLNRQVSGWARHALADTEAVRVVLSKVHGYLALSELRLIELGGSAYGSNIPEEVAWKKSMDDFVLEVKVFQSAGMNSEPLGADLLRQASALDSMIAAARRGPSGFETWRSGLRRPTTLYPDCRTGSREDYGFLVRRLYEPAIARVLESWTAPPAPAASAPADRSQTAGRQMQAFQEALSLAQRAKVMSLGMPPQPTASPEQLAASVLFKTPNRARLKNTVLLEQYVGVKAGWFFGLLAEGSAFDCHIWAFDPGTIAGRKVPMWWLPQRERIAGKQELSFVIAPDGSLCYEDFVRDLLKDPALAGATREVELVPTLGFFAPEWPLAPDSRYTYGTFTGDLVLDQWGRAAAVLRLVSPVPGKNLLVPPGSLWAFLNVKGADFDESAKRFIMDRKVADSQALYAAQSDGKTLSDVIAIRHTR